VQGNNVCFFNLLLTFDKKGISTHHLPVFVLL